jgi:hypothetical protein
MPRKYEINDTRTERVVVTAAQVLAMFATPLTVLKAPGMNKILLVDAIMVQVAPGSAAFAAGGVVSFIYHGGAVAPVGATLTAATVNGAASYNLLQAAAGAVLLPPANTGLDITNITGAFTTGNGTLILTIWYKTHTIG